MGSVVTSPSAVPQAWYNIVPDLPFKLPKPVNSKTGFPVGRHDLLGMISMELVEQELGTSERDVRIPREVRDFYQAWRPTALVRARGFEAALKTPARLYYKYEGTSPTGSHEANTAIPQAYYARRARAKRLVTGSGEGEWAAAVAAAASHFGIRAKVYLTRGSVARRPGVKTAAEVLGAEVVLSPSNATRVGRQALANSPDGPGSVGLAIAEAMEEAITDKDTKCATGTLLNHVVLHQTVIGLEARRQMERLRAQPDVVIGAVGGGSNFGGLVVPFLPLRFAGQPIRFVAAEAAACPSLTRGTYAYDYVDSSGLFPLVKMYTLGHEYTPPTIEAGGMRYHGMSPLISALYANGLIEATSIGQRAALDSALLFARTESLLVSPEAAYCLSAVVDEAKRCRETGQTKTILFGLSAHGHFSMHTYEAHLSALVPDVPPDEAGIQRSLEHLPRFEQAR